MNNRTIITLLTLLLVVLAILILTNIFTADESTTTDTIDRMATSTAPSGLNTSPSTTTGTSTTSDIKEFTVVGSNFMFNPSTINVQRGDTVRVTFQNGGGTHDWVLDQYNVRTNLLQTNQSETVEFVATAAGSFEYYCSVGNHRQMGMRGTLIVAE